MGVETRELPSHVLEVLLDRIRKRMRAAQDPPRRRGEILVNTDGFDQVVAGGSIVITEGLSIMSAHLHHLETVYTERAVKALRDPLAYKTLCLLKTLIVHERDGKVIGVDNDFVAWNFKRHCPGVQLAAKGESLLVSS